MDIACLDLEGVLVPEIWINVAKLAEVPELRATTRDVPDYDTLMRQRLAILADHRIRLQDIRTVIESMAPLEGAHEFLDTMRQRYQVIILSDTFYEFAGPFMRQLGWPTLFCNRLEVDQGGGIVGYRLRQRDQKCQAVRALRSLNYSIIAAGDSYNDMTMLAEADSGILFRPPAGLAQEYPQYPVTRTYEELEGAFVQASAAVTR
ncbi:MAG: bifunctional phosphoserine phosphatase/homoserine phosphotransferase ThrH [Gammaproteobacteria bacterium]|nr:MAG: bifunctional phosphoserine phosphatase/homoserine phosphotransferase ThrH [Gammaproteobacteria bacterium]